MADELERCDESGLAWHQFHGTTVPIINSVVVEEELLEVSEGKVVVRVNVPNSAVIAEESGEVKGRYNFRSLKPYLS